jgi:hypothetical protein
MVLLGVVLGDAEGNRRKSQKRHEDGEEVQICRVVLCILSKPPRQQSSI